VAETLTLNAGTGGVTFGSTVEAGRARLDGGDGDELGGVGAFNNGEHHRGFDADECGHGGDDVQQHGERGSASLKGTAYSVNAAFTRGGGGVTNSGAFTTAAAGTITAPGGFSTTGRPALREHLHDEQRSDDWRGADACGGLSVTLASAVD